MKTGKGSRAKGEGTEASEVRRGRGAELRLTSSPTRAERGPSRGARQQPLPIRCVACRLRTAQPSSRCRPLMNSAPEVRLGQNRGKLRRQGFARVWRGGLVLCGRDEAWLLVSAQYPHRGPCLVS